MRFHGEKLTLRLALTVVLVLGLIVAGCGGSSNSSKPSNQSSAPTKTNSKQGNQSGGGGQGGGAKKAGGTSSKASAKHVAKLTKKQRASARLGVKRFVVCLRHQKLHTKVATSSNAARNPHLSGLTGSSMRITWKGNGADGYVSTRRNVNATAKLVHGNVDVLHQRLIIRYDKKPTKGQSKVVAHCAGVKGIA